MRLPVLLLLATIALGGCGGDGGERLTREEYASQADAVCAKVNEKTRPPANLPLDGYVRYADRALTAIDDGIADLRELKPPENEEAKADAWLDEVESLRTEVERIRDYAQDKNTEGMLRVVANAQRRVERAGALATELGMSVCSMG